MTPAEHHFRWTWQLAAPPTALWPLVSNTDRFNRDCGYPPVTVVPPEQDDGKRTVTNARRLRARVMGWVIEWDELAFEWLAPERYSVERIYHRGPVARMVMSCELAPNGAGGTTLTYDMRLTPSGLLGRLALPIGIGRHARERTEAVFRKDDAFALRGLTASRLAQRPRLHPGGSARLTAAAGELIARGQPPALVARTTGFIREADDVSAARIRPYALADEWRAPRRDVLQLFLQATRVGLLDFSWDLVCPHCRGAKAQAPTLAGINAHAHCDSCNIDFTVNFDRSVELTFAPNPAIRKVLRADYCVGGPQVTPHVIAQQRLPPGARAQLTLDVAPGRYRARTPGVAASQAFSVAADGQPELELEIATARDEEPVLRPRGRVILENSTAQTQVTLLEHLAWTDQATTAAEVTSLQLFRDLFSHEVLRPGEQISVGAMTVVFTDLKNSTELYQEIGDAPAFGRVLTHFDILKAAVAQADGGVVKTMGDAIMAVFPRPVAAVQAMLQAQQWLANPNPQHLPAGVTVPPSSLQPLQLKAGIHVGPCLAINQNERLDYFGSTVNIAARLCGQCRGDDLVLSDAVAGDPEVRQFLAGAAAPACRSESVRLKGFGDTSFAIQRLASAAARVTA